MALQEKEKLIAFWIFKSFVNWLASRLTEHELQQLKTNVAKNSKTFDSITYYPAKKEHAKKLPNSRSGPGSWYIERVQELWRRMCDDPTSKIVHDCYLKWAQVKGCRLDLYSALLLDEAQDTPRLVLLDQRSDSENRQVVYKGEMEEGALHEFLGDNFGLAPAGAAAGKDEL